MGNTAIGKGHTEGEFVKKWMPSSVAMCWRY